jgi:hypothetical protein
VSKSISVTGKLTELRMKHRIIYGRERVHLWRKRERCQRHPKMFGIIEIDGMDQRKSENPRIEEESKELAACAKIKNHIYGVLVNDDDFYIIRHFDHWRTDPNMTISLLFQALRKLKKPWPPHLHIQLDNCIKENKNKFVFFMLLLLVHYNVFTVVRFYFHHS